MTKLEQIARAIYRTFEARPDYAKLQMNDALAGELARVAVEAMREPTDAMVDSCGNGECAKWARGAWANYIDAILSEQPSPSAFMALGQYIPSAEGLDWKKGLEAEE